MTSPRYIITVNRDRIDKGEPKAVRVERTKTGQITDVDSVTLLGWAQVVSGEPRQDGARVWIETDRIVLP